MPTPYATRHFGFLVSHPDVMPYFTRAAILAMDEVDRNDLEKADVRLAELDVDAFRQAIKALPADRKAADECVLYDEDFLERYEDELSVQYEMTGGFRNLRNYHRTDDQDRTDDVRFDYENVYTIALERQPTSLFEQCYRSYVEVEMEIRRIVKAMGVELPKDFPYHDYIGRIDGVVYTD